MCSKRYASKKDNTIYSLEQRKYPPSHSSMTMKGQFKVCARSLFLRLFLFFACSFFHLVLGRCSVYGQSLVLILRGVFN